MLRTILIMSFVMITTSNNEAFAMAQKPKMIGMANPASVNCSKNGGVLRFENTARGVMGVCYFDDNRQCEEWALFRNECPKGGVKVTGYVTKAARYCVILGGNYQSTGQLDEKDTGICTLPNGKNCDVWELFDGNCSK